MRPTHEETRKASDGETAKGSLGWPVQRRTRMEEAPDDRCVAASRAWRRARRNCSKEDAEAEEEGTEKPEERRRAVAKRA